ncbi:MAG TPA: insulinase family protein [Bacteroidetes bacterium]|nr:insulinase family protein [Bacteroidota bacterium]
MKKFTVSTLALFFFSLSPVLFAQQANQKLPSDPEVVTGTLKNGLRYYIRHNEKPNKRVEFRLVVNAGSILEDDDQQGLAHFCEHMAFNGSKHFNKNQLVDFLEESGMRFGADLNASTSFDETIYQFQIPTDRQGLVDSAFLILEDWAHNLLFDPKEIDKERGVIHEEWRMGLGAQDRMQKKYFPLLFRGSRYAERLPIGKMDIVMHCKYETLKRFYHDWYRPDLMAVIVVGDIDPAAAKKQILKHFKKIKNPKPERERKVYGLSDNNKPIIAIATDKEATNNQVAVFWKHTKSHLITENDYRRSLMLSLVSGMLNNRFYEISQKPDAPFMYAGCGYGGFLVRTKDAWQCVAIPKTNKIQEAFSTLIKENMRAKKYGFTPGELEREKAEIISNYDNMLKEKNKTNSSAYAEEYIRNYLEQEAFPGIENEYALVKKLLPGITLEELNSAIDTLITRKNVEVLVTGPDKKDNIVPDSISLLIAYKTALVAPVTAYVDKKITKNLITEPLPGSRVVSTQKNDTFGFTEVKLSNGVTVILKPTTFKNDEILMDSYNYGGSSLAPDDKAFMARMTPTVITQSGVGPLNAADLNKFLSGKQVSVSPKIGELTEGISGNSTRKDFETMLKLTYLYFTQPRKDEEAFRAFRSKLSSQVRFLRSNPQMVFIDTLYKLSASNNPRYFQIPSAKQINDLNLDDILAFYKDRFADAEGFHFFFVGNFKVDTILPLLQKYLGSLPAINRKDAWRDVSPEFPKGITKTTVHKGSEPKSLVALLMEDEFDWSAKNKVIFNMTMNILNIRLREIMRENESKVYGVGIQKSTSKYPKPEYNILINWGCSPDNVEGLIKTVFQEMDHLRNNPPTTVNLEKARETMIRELQTNNEQNNYWLGKLKGSFLNQDKLLTLEELETIIQSIIPADIQGAARRFFTPDHYLQVVLLPEK